jgi:glycerate 2-kinase
MAHFDPTVLTPDPVRRSRILPVLEAALAAVDPYQAVQNFLKLDGSKLTIGDQQLDLDQYQRVLVLGAGKAGAPMVAAVEERLGDRISGGLMVVKSGHGGPSSHVEVVEASHPMPDAAGVAAGKRILELAAMTGPDDLVIVLLSGGGSALLVAPAEGVTLADKQAMTDALLSCGANIQEINCLRKHCSALKGGQLARAAMPAHVATLALSDVIGSPLDVIASGPTVPDRTTWHDAWEIVQRYELAQKLPTAIIRRLEAGLAGDLADTPKAGDPAFARTINLVVADNRLAAEAAARAAAAQGFNPILLTTYLEGEASQVAKVLVALGKEVHTHHAPVAPPACLILGGETTVTLGTQSGQGGRNQELALGAALALRDHPAITIVALATDGTDGPTDSAGAMADSKTVERAAAAKLDAVTHLRRHDAYPLLSATRDLLHTGPTQTNVNDLLFVFIE